jgi:hypothetical protein
MYLQTVRLEDSLVNEAAAIFQMSDCPAQRLLQQMLPQSPPVKVSAIVADVVVAHSIGDCARWCQVE